MHVQAFIICFKENSDRRNLLKERFLGIGFDPVFIDAVRGSTLSDAEKSPFLNSGRQYITASMMQDNAMGCTLSHFKAWEALLAGDAPFAFIFEDDAGPIQDDIMPRIRGVVEMADQLDVVILSNRRENLKRVKVKDMAGDAGLYAMRYNDFGLESYFITKEAARTFLDHPHRFSTEVDFLIHHWWHHDRQVLHLLPPLFAEDGRTSTIGYSNVPLWPDDRIRHRISRRFIRASDSMRKRLCFPGYVSRIKARLAHGGSA
ncbi:glycosyltransferase family 25 protein [Alphaproteobacteria bacterium LSUCC0684]